MNPGVTVRTACIKRPGPFGGNTAACLLVEAVALMALEAEEGLTEIEQFAVDRAVGAVAVEAVLGHIRMSVEERPAFVRMALDAGFPDAVLKQAAFRISSVRIVAVYAKYPAFLEGMMARQGKLRLGGLMAGETKVAGGHGRDFQVRTGVDIMAVEAGDLVEGVEPGVPVMQVEGGVGGVAFEADERLRRGRQVFQVDQCLEIAGGLDALPGVRLNHFSGQALDSQTAWAVTGFTIHEGHPGILFQLGAHRAGVKEQLQPVMFMAGGKAVAGADVIGIKAADNHFFVLANRQNRP